MRLHYVPMILVGVMWIILFLANTVIFYYWGVIAQTILLALGLSLGATGILIQFTDAWKKS